MPESKTTEESTTDAQEVARQAEVELAIILGVEQSLRVALQWMTRGRGNNHKLSTLRFHAWSFERNLSRIRVLADHGGYLHLITDTNPHLADKVRVLKNRRDVLHADLTKIIARLDHVSRDDADGFGRICADLLSFLNGLRAHGEKESALLRQSFNQQEEGDG